MDHSVLFEEPAEPLGRAAKKARELALPERPALAPGAMDALAAYDWPGNVRELENIVERAMILSRGAPLDFGAFLAPPRPHGQRAASAPKAPEDTDGYPTLAEIQARHIRETLRRTDGRVHGPNGAAALLGINASTLRNRMNKLGVPYGRRTKG